MDASHLQVSQAFVQGAAKYFERNGGEMSDDAESAFVDLTDLFARGSAETSNSNSNSNNNDSNNNSPAVRLIAKWLQENEATVTSAIEKHAPETCLAFLVLELISYLTFQEALYSRSSRHVQQPPPQQQEQQQTPAPRGVRGSVSLSAPLPPLPTTQQPQQPPQQPPRAKALEAEFNQLEASLNTSLEKTKSRFTLSRRQTSTASTAAGPAAASASTPGSNAAQVVKNQLVARTQAMSAYISSKIGSAPSSSSAEQQQQQQQQPPPPVPSHFVGGDSDEECDDDGNPNDDGEEMSCFLVAKFFTSRANNAPVEPVAVPVDLSNIPQTIGWNNLAAIPNLNINKRQQSQVLTVVPESDQAVSIPVGFTAPLVNVNVHFKTRANTMEPSEALEQPSGTAAATGAVPPHVQTLSRLSPSPPVGVYPIGSRQFVPGANIDTLALTSKPRSKSIQDAN